MKGETTLDERIMRQLNRLEEVRRHYAKRFTYMDTNFVGHDQKVLGWPENLAGQLIADATYLATYYGLDLETLIKETVESVRRDFPDTC